MERVVLLTIFNLILTSSAKPAPYTSTSPEADLTLAWDGGPDISRCKRSSEPNPWSSVAVSPEPFPDFPSANPDLDTSFHNSTFNRAQQSQQSDNDLPWLCRQLASHSIDPPTSGYVRTRDAPVVESNSHYWVIWRTDYYAVVTVWQSQLPLGPWYNKVYTSPQKGELQGQVAITGSDPHNRVRVDMRLSEGDGRGTGGSLALFQFNHSPPPPT